jgi:hypothetical protein
MLATAGIIITGLSLFDQHSGCVENGEAARLATGRRKNK